MKTLIRWMVLFAILSGCASQSVSLTDLGFSAGTDQIERGCVIASAAIKALTVANNAGNLSPAQQDRVLRAIGLIDPICKSPAPPTLDASGQSAFLAAVHALQTTQGELKP